MTPEQEQIYNLQNATVALLRSKLNALIYRLGLGASNSSAKLTSLVVILFLSANIFFFLNLSIAFLFSALVGSYALGFFLLVLLYALLLLVYLFYRKRVESKVQNNIAKKVNYISDDLNQKLNEVNGLWVDEPFKEVYIASEPYPYEALQLRHREAMRQAHQAGVELKVGVAYVKQNYIKIFGSVAQTRIPAYRYVAPWINFFTKDKSQKKLSRPTMTQPQKAGLWERTLPIIKPYMPIIGTTYKFLYPVLSAFLLGKTQNWLLHKLLSRKKRKR